MQSYPQSRGNSVNTQSRIGFSEVVSSNEELLRSIVKETLNSEEKKEQAQTR